jgi:hypothetical protein
VHAGESAGDGLVDWLPVRGRALVSTLVASLLGLAIGFGIAVRFPPPDTGVSSSKAGARVRKILTDDDPLRRAAELARLLQRAEPEALPAIREAYEEAPLDGGDLELVLLGSWWAGFDPQAAVAWTSTEWRANYASVLMAVFRTWARREPRKALARARELRFRVQREMSVQAAYVGWDESGQPGLLEFIRALPEPAERQAATEVLARRRVVTLGPEGALRWAEALPEGNDGFRVIASARVASAASELDPAVAAAWAEPLITAGNERPSGLARRVATRWVWRDPEAAMAWLATLPPGKDRNDGVTEAFRDWMSRERAAAVGWIEARSMEPWLEPAFGLYARLISRERPQEALEVVGRISDEELRNRTTTLVARLWLANDPEAAEAWLTQADIPDDVRKRAYMRPRRPQGQRTPGPAGPAAPPAPK